MFSRATSVNELFDDKSSHYNFRLIEFNSSARFFYQHFLLGANINQLRDFLQHVFTVCILNAFYGNFSIEMLHFSLMFART